MSRLILVRHGQASFSPDPSRAFADYDRLSPLGIEQGVALGEELLAAGIEFDKVYSGPAVRQRQTAEAVGSVYARHSRPWPSLRTDEGLEEHDGAGLVQSLLSGPEHSEERLRLGIEAPSGEASAEGVRRRTAKPHSTREYLTVFRKVTRRWVRGELRPGLVDESWQAFRARVEAGVRRIMEESGRGATVVGFTSGGPIGSTVAWALGLGDEQALELAWVVENATLTEFLFSDGRMSLKSFNVQPRLGSPGLVTHV
ncbi:MAG TPA: histidine phosphatase family protein [Longimicrobiales bacterium]|nr:histidine phosphatase family protein [Longimicrobiales bacterium]